MSLLFCDGFDDGLYTTKWLDSGSTIATTGRFNTKSLKLAYNGGFTSRKVITASQTIIVGFAHMTSSFANYHFMALYSDSGSTSQVSLRFSTIGQIQLYRGGTLVATSTRTLSLNQWNFIELKTHVDDVSGTMEVRVDGVSWVTFSGDTRNAGTSPAIDVIGFGTYAGVNQYIDDLYICNTTGTVNNDFLGDVRIETIKPNANGSSSMFTGSDGNKIDNYLLVNEATPSAADYVASSVAGDKDLYAFGDLSNPGSVVKGVQINSFAAKSDTGLRSITNLVKSGATEATGSTTALSTSYNTTSDIKELDPATNAAWTVSGINGAEFGVRVD